MPSNKPLQRIWSPHRRRRRLAGAGLAVRRSLLYPTMASAGTLVLHFVARLPWGLAALAASVGLPVVGTVITIDDDVPGGWSNPDGKQRPDWLRARFWGRLLAGLAASAVVAGLDGDWVPRRLMLFGGGALAAATVSGPLLRRRAAEQADEPAGPRRRDIVVSSNGRSVRRARMVIGKAFGRQRVVQRYTSRRLPTFTMGTSFVESSIS